MRLDLSKEQISYIIDSLTWNIEALKKEGEKQKIKGSVKDIVNESITVQKSTLLYLKDVMKDK